MATTTGYQGGSVGTRSEGVTGPVPEAEERLLAARLTSEQVWKAIANASFAVLSHVTPSGEPRSSGVVYKVVPLRKMLDLAGARARLPVTPEESSS